MMDKNDIKDKIYKIIRITVFITAIIQLALSQLSIRIARLSAAELTGISYFAFIILGLVTLFSVSRMGESAGIKLFAILMNFVTSLSAVWYLRLLFSDEMFFRNLYYNLNRQTQVFELIPLGSRIASSVPLAMVILGALIYCLCAIAILTASFVSLRKKSN
jgi:hypothetical protein